MTSGVEHPMVFLVGVGRSGTSLLQSMLHSHSDICFLPETAFVRRFLAHGQLKRLIRNHGIEPTCERLANDTVLARLGLAPAVLSSLIAEHHEDPPLLFLRLMQAHCNSSRPTTWLGDKDPRGIEYLPWLARAFPQAKVIHIQRDVRDTLASRQRAKWSRNRPLLHHLFACLAQHRLAHRHGKSLFGNNYLIVRYEELVTAPMSVLSTVCKFLDLRFEQRMLDFTGASAQLVAADEMAWKADTLSPLRSANVNLGGALLSRHQRIATTQLCREMLTQQPADPSESSSPLAWLYRCLRPAFVLACDLYGRYRDWSQRPCG